MVSRLSVALCGAVLAASTAGGQTSKTAKTATPGKSPAPARLHYFVAPTGNEARYRVREQLVRVNLPNDAIGKTNEITGQLLVDPDGTVIRDSSKITVVVTNLKSDKERRDNFIKRKVLESEKYPIVTLVPSTFKGVSAKPGDAPVAFELTGDLTVHGVTHPTKWKVLAKADGSDIVGSASTAFTFDEFTLEQPKVPVLLSVADTIKLEYDFRFTPAVWP
jgi:polyisoprenoid-binding protein YceI